MNPFLFLTLFPFVLNFDESTEHAGSISSVNRGFSVFHWLQLFIPCNNYTKIVTHSLVGRNISQSIIQSCLHSSFMKNPEFLKILDFM